MACPPGHEENDPVRLIRYRSGGVFSCPHHITYMKGTTMTVTTCTHTVLPASAPIATRCPDCDQLRPYQPRRDLDLLVVVRRYDEPSALFGCHEFVNSQYAKAPVLITEPEAEVKIQSFLDEGFVSIDPYPISQEDQEFYSLVKMSLPIEFHAGWRDADEEMLGRIRTYIKTARSI